MTQAQKNDLA